MITIRRWVFETNSSSTHSISISEWELIDVSKFIKDDFVLEIWEYFHENWEYSYWETKLWYAYLYASDSWKNKKLITDVFEEFTWRKLIVKYGNYTYIEEQYDISMIFEWTDEDIKNKLKYFIFCKDSYVERNYDW